MGLPSRNRLCDALASDDLPAGSVPAQPLAYLGPDTALGERVLPCEADGTAGHSETRCSHRTVVGVPSSAFLGRKLSRFTVSSDTLPVPMGFKGKTKSVFDARAHCHHISRGIERFGNKRHTHGQTATDQNRL